MPHVKQMTRNVGKHPIGSSTPINVLMSTNQISKPVILNRIKGIWRLDHALSHWER